eukprot:140546_1
MSHTNELKSLQWNCSICTYSNIPETSKCAMCNNTKTIKNNDKWSCKICTYLNEVNALKCDICESLKTSNNDEWDCKFCSFKNRSIHAKCSMCNNTKSVEEIKDNPEASESSQISNSGQSNTEFEEKKENYMNPLVFDSRKTAIESICTDPVTKNWSRYTVGNNVNTHKTNLPKHSNELQCPMDLTYCSKVLKQFNTHLQGFECDHCGTKMKLDAIMFGCRGCNFDLCEKCAVKERQAQLTCFNDTIYNCGFLERLLSINKRLDEQTITEEDLNTINHDFVHLLRKHDDDDSFEFIYEKVGGFCSSRNCSVIMRSYRDRFCNETTTTITYKQQLLDTVHCYYRHTYDIGYRLNKVERSRINQVDVHSENVLFNKKLSEIMQIIRSKHEANTVLRNENRYTAQNINKFVTNFENKDDDFTLIDRLNEIIIQHEMEFTFVTNLSLFLKANDFDTDAVEYDLYDAENSNISNYVNNEQDFEIIAIRFRQQKTLEQQQIVVDMYDFGVQWIYEESQKQIMRKYETNCVAIGFSKYSSFKEELISNNGAIITIVQFNNELKKAKIKYHSLFCKQLIEKTLRLYLDQKDDYNGRKMYHTFNNGANIVDYNPNDLQVHHILAVLIYCNMDVLQYEFSKTYRKITKNETIESVRSRHAEFYYFGKYLKTVVNDFGEFCDMGYMGHKKPETFYHGINKCLLLPLNSAINRLFIPVSTSSSFSVAAYFAGQADGIVVDFIGLSCYRFPCSWLSDFANEKEHLFLQAPFKGKLQFTNILHCNTSIEQKNILQVIDYLECLTNYEEQTESFKQLTIALIESELGIKTFKSINDYSKRLFHYFCVNLKKINIRYGYFQHFMFRFLGPLFCSRDETFANIELLCKLFPNALFLYVDDFSWIDCSWNETASYILSSLKKVKAKLLTIKIGISGKRDHIMECFFSKETKLRAIGWHVGIKCKGNCNEKEDKDEFVQVYIYRTSECQLI